MSGSQETQDERFHRFLDEHAAGAYEAPAAATSGSGASVAGTLLEGITHRPDPLLLMLGAILDQLHAIARILGASSAIRSALWEPEASVALPAAKQPTMEEEGVAVEQAQEEVSDMKKDCPPKGNGTKGTKSTTKPKGK